MRVQKGTRHVSLHMWMCAFSQYPFVAFDSRYFTPLPFLTKDTVFGCLKWLSQVIQLTGIKTPLSCHKIQFASHNPCYLVTTKSFYGENTVRIPKCITMEIVHQNCSIQLYESNNAIILGAMYSSWEKILIYFRIWWIIMLILLSVITRKSNWCF